MSKSPTLSLCVLVSQGRIHNYAILLINFSLTSNLPEKITMHMDLLSFTKAAAHRGGDRMILCRTYFFLFLLKKRNIDQNVSYSLPSHFGTVNLLLAYL